MPKDVKKHSIKEVDYLIDSIKKSNPGLTEEGIAKALGYGAGYISQMRTREDSSNKPQVSPKFMDKLKQNAGRLQNANSDDLRSNLHDIKRILRSLENGQAYVIAEIRGYGQYQIQQQVGWDQKKFLAEMARVGSIIGANLEAGGLQDNGKDGGT